MADISLGLTPNITFLSHPRGASAEGHRDTFGIVILSPTASAPDKGPDLYDS